MKYGIYYAYWEKEWNGDYKYYIDKISKLGFDILEISCGAFSDYYTKDQELIDIGKYAKEKGVTLTAGYGPHFNESLSSSEPNTQCSSLLLTSFQALSCGSHLTRYPLSQCRNSQPVSR